MGEHWFCYYKFLQIHESDILPFIIYVNIHLRELVITICCLHEKKPKQQLSCYKLLVHSLNVNLRQNFIWFSYISYHNHLSFACWNNKICDFNSYFFIFFNMSFLSSAGASVKYVLPLIFSMPPFILLTIRYKDFALFGIA